MGTVFRAREISVNFTQNWAESIIGVRFTQTFLYGKWRENDAKFPPTPYRGQTTRSVGVRFTQTFLYGKWRENHAKFPLPSEIVQTMRIAGVRFTQTFP